MTNNRRPFPSTVQFQFIEVFDLRLDREITSELGADLPGRLPAFSGPPLPRPVEPSVELVCQGAFTDAAPGRVMGDGAILIAGFSVVMSILNDWANLMD